jgi:endonuclease/exonuclease/phosphatase family metal-dependent hydrolase
MTTDSDFECILTRVTLNHNTFLYLACVYRPTTDAHQLQNAIRLLKQHLATIDIKECQQYTLIMGDFNLDWLDSSTQKVASELSPNYTQHIRSVTTDYNSIFDHLYTDLPSDGILCYTTECYYSDHKPLVCAIRI